MMKIIDIVVFAILGYIAYHCYQTFAVSSHILHALAFDLVSIAAVLYAGESVEQPAFSSKDIANYTQLIITCYRVFIVCIELTLPRMLWRAKLADRQMAVIQPRVFCKKLMLINCVMPFGQIGWGVLVSPLKENCTKSYGGRAVNIHP